MYFESKHRVSFSSNLRMWNLNFMYSCLYVCLYICMRIAPFTHYYCSSWSGHIKNCMAGSLPDSVSLLDRLCSLRIRISKVAAMSAGAIALIYTPTSAAVTLSGWRVAAGCCTSAPTMGATSTFWTLESTRTTSSGWASMTASNHAAQLKTWAHQQYKTLSSLVRLRQCSLMTLQYIT